MMEASHPQFKRRANWYTTQTYAGSDPVVGPRPASLAASTRMSAGSHRVRGLSRLIACRLDPELVCDRAGACRCAAFCPKCMYL